MGVRARGRNWTVYVVWFWMLATFANFRIRSVTELTKGHTFDAQVLFQVASWLCFGIFAVWAAFRGRADWSLVRRGPLTWYCGFILIALLSAVYSPFPGLSAFTAIQHGIALVLTISLGRHLRRSLHFALIYVIVNWLLVILGALHMNFRMDWITAPGASRIWTDEATWRFASAFGHPSQIGIVAAATALMIFKGSKGSFEHAAYILLMVVTLLLTDSRTAIAGFAAGLIYILVKQRRIIVLCVIGSCMILTLLIAPSRALITAYLSRGQSSGDINSLTGRTPVYKDALSRVADHWVLGQGFLSTRVLLLNDQGDGNGTVHPHDLLLAALTGMGIGGAILAVGSVFSLRSTVRKLIIFSGYYPRSRQQALRYSATMMPLIAFCILDSGFVAKMGPFVLLYLVFAAQAQDALLSVYRENNIITRPRRL